MTEDGINNAASVVSTLRVISHDPDANGNVGEAIALCADVLEAIIDNEPVDVKPPKKAGA